MPQLNGKLFGYLAIGLVVLLVGLNSIRSGKSASEPPAGPGTVQKMQEDAGFRIDGGSRKLVVDVSGAVRRPGVYRFTQGDRVVDAIRRAGGASPGAAVAGINRAATLSDGQQVVVPASAPGGSRGNETGPASGPGPDVPVSLGAATREQLEQIDGIGPVTAEKILEFRDSQGGLASIEELDQVSGIGPVTMESLRVALAP